jgi:hypothetical protein
MTLSSEILLRNSSSLEDSMVGSAAQEDIQVPSKILMLCSGIHYMTKYQCY